MNLYIELNQSNRNFFYVIAELIYKFLKSGNNLIQKFLLILKPKRDKTRRVLRSVLM